MNNIHKLKFYGSCGHTEEEIISIERFENLSAERLSKTIFGDFLVKAEVTNKENEYTVHIVPERFCCCNKCMLEDMEENMKDYKK